MNAKHMNWEVDPAHPDCVIVPDYPLSIGAHSPERAARIVLCVNTHDELVKACEKALGVLAGEDMNKQALIEALGMCRAALAKTGIAP